MWIFCTDKTFSDTILTRRKISSCFFGQIFDAVVKVRFTTKFTIFFLCPKLFLC